MQALSDGRRIAQLSDIHIGDYTTIGLSLRIGVPPKVTLLTLRKA